MDLRVESQEELNTEMDKLIKKKKLFEIDQEKLNIQMQQFEIYKRKSERELRELHNLREFKRKILESGNFPDNIDLEDRGVDILHSPNNLTDIMEESRKNNQTRAMLARDLENFFNQQKNFKEKLATLKKRGEELDRLQEEQKNKESQLENEKKTHELNVEKQNQEYMDTFLEKKVMHEYKMSKVTETKNEIDLAQKLLLSKRAEHEQNVDVFLKNKSKFEKQKAEHKLNREAFIVHAKKFRKSTRTITKEHEETEQRHIAQLHHIQNQTNLHQDKSENFHREQQSFAKKQYEFVKLQIDQSENIKLYQDSLAKLYEQEDQLDQEKIEHVKKMKACSKFHAKAKEYEELEEKITKKEKIHKQLDIKRRQYDEEKQKLKDDAKAMQMVQKAFTKKQLQFDKNMNTLNDEIDKHERNVNNYHIAKKDLTQQESDCSTSRELLDTKNENIQKKIDKYEIDKLTIEKQKKKLLKLAERHRLDVVELKKSQEEVKHLRSVYNDEKSWHISEKDLHKRRKNIHEEKMQDERMLIIKQRNQHLKKLTVHDELETKLEEEKIKFKKQLQQFEVQKFNQEKERCKLEEKLKNKIKNVQCKEKQLEHDQRAYETTRTLSRTTLEFLMNEKSQSDGPNTNSQGSQTNASKQKIEDKNVLLKEEMNNLKKEKSELLQHIDDVKHMHAIEQYNLMKEKQQNQQRFSDHKKDVDQLVKSQELQDSYFKNAQKEFDSMRAVLLEEKNNFTNEKEHLVLDQQILAKQTELLAQKELHLNSRIEEYDRKYNELKN